MSPASATGTTGANGEFTFSYTSSATSGAYPIAATIAGVTDTQSVTVQAAANVDPVPVRHNDCLGFCFCQSQCRWHQCRGREQQ
jgi:hypothetical protein